MLGDMGPVGYCLAKAMRIGIWYLYETSRGSRTTSLQNADHISQCPLAAADLLIESPLTIMSAAARKLSQKRVHYEESTVAM